MWCGDLNLNIEVDFDMNKHIRAIDEETYKSIFAIMESGFIDANVNYKPNVRIATVLVIEYNLGLEEGICMHYERSDYRARNKFCYIYHK